MAMPNIPGLEELLEKLPLDKFPTDDVAHVIKPLGVNAVITQHDDTYAVHLFVPGCLDSELTGKKTRGQWNFQRLNLKDLSTQIEDVLTQSELYYHRDPPMPPTENQEMVSYRLVPHMDDKGGRTFYRAVRELLDLLLQKNRAGGFIS